VDLALVPPSVFLLLIPQHTHKTCDKNRPGAYFFEFKSAPEDVNAILHRNAFRTKVQGMKTQIRLEFNVLINAFSAQVDDLSELESLMALDELQSVTPIVSGGMLEREKK